MGDTHQGRFDHGQRHFCLCRGNPDDRAHRIVGHADRYFNNTDRPECCRREDYFKATGNYAGGLTQDLTNSVNLTWTSSKNGVATIINVPKKTKGLAKGVSIGSVTIKATVRRGAGIGTSGTTTLTVN